MYKLKVNPRPDLCKVFGCGKRRGNKQVLCSQHALRLWRHKNPIRSAWNDLVTKCRRKKRELGLTFEQFQEFVSRTRYIDNKGRERHCFHIDRIDPSRGYHMDNIQVLTCSENTAKGNRERNPF